MAGNRSGLLRKHEPFEVHILCRLGADESQSYGFRVGNYDKSKFLILDPATLVYAGFIGGSGVDYGYSVALDGLGNAYITGQARSDESTFPDGDGFGAVPGPDQTFNGGFNGDAFVAKVNAAGTALVYAGYIGGSEYDSGYGIAVDSSGNAYVTGFTQSTETTFPDGDGFGAVPGFDQTANGFSDAYVVKISD